MSLALLSALLTVLGTSDVRDSARGRGAGFSGCRLETRRIQESSCPCRRYFKKVGDDYYPLPAQWDFTHQRWAPYFVKNGTDWWSTLYPPENMQRPTGPLCDGCHSVDYDITTRKVADWNVGCERCHGPGSEHVAHQGRPNIVNPAKLDYVHANDVCIQCHSQGQPLTNPIQGQYYDWPVGFQVGKNLSDFWKLEEHKLGVQSFTHFADGTAHKNRTPRGEMLYCRIQ